MARCRSLQRMLKGWSRTSFARRLSTEGGPADDRSSDSAKDFGKDPVVHVDRELEEFLLGKGEEEGLSTSRLFSTPVAPLPSALEEALLVCEDQLEKLDDPPKTSPSTSEDPPKTSPSTSEDPPSNLSSKFGSSRPKFMKELQSDIELDDFSGAASDDRLQHGMIQDFLDGFAKAKEQSRVASSFGPLKQTPYKALSLNSNLTDHRPLPSGKPRAEGGFRINVYRNLTGSVKELMIKIRRDALDKVIHQVKSESSGNEAFVEKLLESLKYVDVTVKGDLRPKMNALCLSLMECLDRLTPNEAALVCLVFGQLGYSNSLVYYQLISKIQKQETLNAMSIEALSGAVVSLGMLQSTDPEFMDTVLKEFMRRVETDEKPMPPGVFACLLLGCSHSRETDKAHTMTHTLIDCLNARLLHEDDRSVDWLDLAVGTYVCSEMKLLKPDLFQGIRNKLEGTKGRWDMTCTETAVLLVGLEGLSPLVYNRPLQPIWKEIYTSLEDHVGYLIERKDVRLTSVPDLIRNLSFPGLERMERYKALGRLLIDSDSEKTPLPVWPLVHRLMSGYANVLYRDPEVLKALNARFRSTRMPQLQASTVANLLHVGCRLRGLEESVVNRIVELVTPKSVFWQRVFRFKDAAKIAYSLAAFDKLTPEIFGECWKRCEAVRFDQYDDMVPEEAVDTMFIAQGLFVGYDYIRQKFSASVARKQISLKGHRDLFGIIKKKNQTASGQETSTQREVSKYLERMGVNLSCPALILDGLYRVDTVFQDAKVVVYVCGDRSFYSNPPYSMTGAMLVVKRAIQSHKIKVVIIKESDWKKTPEEERTSFLVQAFNNEGIKLEKWIKQTIKEASSQQPSVEEHRSRMSDWLGVRSTVLNGMIRSKLIELLKSRSELLAVPEDDPLTLLTAEILSKNDIVQSAPNKKSINTKRKSEIINDILLLEVRSLFGDALTKLSESSGMAEALEVPSEDREEASLMSASG